jgi:hypothetical protein
MEPLEGAQELKGFVTGFAQALRLLVRGRAAAQFA